MDKSEIKRSDIIHLFLFSLIIMALLGGRYAATKAVDTDELFSLLTAEKKPSEFMKNLSDYTPGYYDQPPLFFLLLRNVLLFSSSPLALRLLPMLFGALSAFILGVFLLQENIPRWCALVFIVLFLSNPLVFSQSNFCRMYTLVLFLSSILFFVISLPGIGETRAKQVRYVLFCGFILNFLYYTSYFTALVGMSYALLGAIWFISGGGWLPRPVKTRGFLLLMASVLAGLLYLYWIPVMMHFFRSETQGAGTETVLRLKDRIRFLWEYFHAAGGTLAGLAVILLGWVFLLKFHKARRYWMVYGLTLIVLPILIFAILAPSTRRIAPRYVIFTSPPLWMGAVLGLYEIVQRIRPMGRSARAALIVLLLIPIPFNIYTVRRSLMIPAPDWWEAASILERHAKPEEVILTGGFLSGEAIVYHLKNPEHYQFIHYVTKLDDFYVQCRKPETFWYVNAAPLPKAYRDILLRYFPYSASFAGNLSIGYAIEIFSKKPFTLTHGMPSTYTQPVPLPYEQTR